ncbi:serine protease snake-like [Venturia canescens]|uniref:serine protease snake-like n=1 Tax=Venturia canescens TaxID=32260 RepID=UPI001C9C0593|nr:serine protease snake-like [Venturia canescens]
MSIDAFHYYCAFIIPLLGFHTSGFPFEQELYEGSQCETELGIPGVCKRLLECPPRLKEALEGKRGPEALGRCCFDGSTEIVCCAQEQLDRKISVRPIELACQEYQNELITENEIASDSTETSTRAAVVNKTTTSADDGLVHPFIYAGVKARRGEFPFMVSLGYENTDGELDDPIVYDCGGALITSKYVLTAAHCVSNINNRTPKWARVGFVDIRSAEAIEIPLDSVIPHPRYRRSQNYHDIALLTLSTSLRNSNLVRPICLQARSMQDSDINSNTSFMVIGFGGTEKADRSEKLLKSANLDLVSNAACKEAYKVSSRLPNGIDDTLICALDRNSTRGSDACQGDSGGPLLMKSGKVYTVIGVTSFGQGCGSLEPGAYTSVSAYIDWIESIVWPEKIKS